MTLNEHSTPEEIQTYVMSAAEALHRAVHAALQQYPGTRAVLVAEVPTPIADLPAVPFVVEVPNGISTTVRCRMLTGAAMSILSDVEARAQKAGVLSGTGVPKHN